MATFEQIFPTFLQKCAELHALLRVVAFMLFIVGTITFVMHGFSPKTMMLHLVRLLILTALLVLLPEWGNRIQELLQESIVSGLGVDPAAVRDEPQGDDVGVPFRRKRGDAQDHRTVDEEADRAVVGCSLRHACRISP